MFCPKCRKEYEEGIVECSDCKEVLLEELEYSEKYLLTVTSDMEKNIVVDILKDAGIDVVNKGNMPFGSIIGNMPLGFDIYVREEDWQLARDILESDDFESDGIEELNDKNIKKNDEVDRDIEKVKKYNLRLIAGLIIILVLACIACKIVY